MSKCNIGVLSGLIQDGNYYNNFESKKVYEFAVNFSVRNIKKSNNEYIFMKHLGNTNYLATGKIVFVKENFWVVDFGILMSSFVMLPEYIHEISIGNYITGEIHLDIDFSYSFYSSKFEGLPALIYNWEVDKIVSVIAPDYDDITFERNKDKWKYIEIPATNAWKDNGGDAYYILECQKLDIEPKYKKTI